MEDTHHDFPPLTARQKFLLDEIKSLKEELEALPPWDSQTGTWVPEFYEIQKKIDDLSVKALRSGLLRGLSADSRHPGFRLVFDSHGEYEKVLPRFGDFHPDLPPWAEKHFLDWIQMLRIRRQDARDTLRETGIVGIETGMKRPIDGSEIERWELIKRRVLELRDARVEKDDDMRSTIANAPPLDPLAENQVELRNRMRLTPEMLKIAKQQCKAHANKKKKRTRKKYHSWNWIIKKLVEEGLLANEISPQALRKRLINLDPDFPWNEV